MNYPLENSRAEWSFHSFTLQLSPRQWEVLSSQCPSDWNFMSPVKVGMLYLKIIRRPAQQEGLCVVIALRPGREVSLSWVLLKGLLGPSLALSSIGVEESIGQWEPAFFPCFRSWNPNSWIHCLNEFKPTFMLWPFPRPVLLCLGHITNVLTHLEPRDGLGTASCKVQQGLEAWARACVCWGWVRRKVVGLGYGWLLHMSHRILNLNLTF